MRWVLSSSTQPPAQNILFVQKPDDSFLDAAGQDDWLPKTDKKSIDDVWLFDKT